MVCDDWSVSNASTLSVRTINNSDSDNACKGYVSGLANTRCVLGAKDERRKRYF